MSSTKKTNQQLIEELNAFRRRLARLESLQAEPDSQKATHDSELGYRVLYEENPSMYFTVDSEGIVLSVNPFGAQQLGYTVEELLHQPVLSVFHDDDRSKVREALQRCIDQPGETFNWEFRKVRKDGVLMWVREAARAVPGDGGSTAVFIVCEDITDHKALELNLRESRERYKTLYTRTPVMLHSIDAKGRLVEVSGHWLKTLGYQRHEVIGRKSTEFLTEESQLFAKEKILPEFFRTGRIQNAQYQFVKKNGELMDILLSGIAEYDSKGEFVRSLAVLIDVTEHNRTEEALRKARDELERRVAERTAELERQHRFLRQVIDVDPNFIFAKNRDGQFTLVNQAIAEAYGTSVDKLIGKKDADFNPNKEEVEHFRRMDLEVMDTLEDRFIREEPITDSENQVRWLQTVKRPMLNEDGNADQVLGSATDITRRKEAEERLRQSEMALRKSQKELRLLAGRLLTAQEDERRRLAREMHDDLSQQMAALAIRLGTLEHNPSVSAEEAAILAEIRDDLGKLSSDTHALARRLHPSMLEDLGLVDAIAEECSGFSGQSGMNIQFVHSNVPGDVSNDVAICLYRITQEALRNVAKHANTTEARVFLRGSDDELSLSIEDDGSGFDSDQSGGGKGMGLASMEERARLVRAEWSVISQPGKGTTVNVVVPRHGRRGC